jgi:hypothetical protein
MVADVYAVSQSVLQFDSDFKYRILMEDIENDENISKDLSEQLYMRLKIIDCR